MAEEISKWANTQATREVECPRCHAAPGKSCKRPNGDFADMHGERSKAYRDAIGPAEWEKRHQVKMAGGFAQKGRIDQIIRGTGRVNAVGSDKNVAGSDTNDALTKWRD